MSEAQTNTTPARQRRCKRCGSEKAVPIVRGLPDDELFQAAERGEVFLGGCHVGGEQARRHCLACEHEW